MCDAQSPLKEQWVPILGGYVYCFHLFIQQTVTGTSFGPNIVWNVETQRYNAMKPVLGELLPNWEKDISNTIGQASPSLWGCG